jgi:hypothetical protein
VRWAMWKWLFGEKKNRDAIIIVSGLPRSGTSMMMRMLEAGGVEIVTDHMRQADEDNPQGYFEFEPAKKVKDDASFLDDMHGRAVKIISMLLYDLPATKHYKIIFMRRNLKEVLRSQRLMLQRNAKDPQETSDEAMERIFEHHLSEITQWLRTQKNMQVLYVDYHDVLHAALASAREVNRFLGARLDVHKMAAAVEPSLYRNRSATRKDQRGGMV